jgi:hypothetical protein
MPVAAIARRLGLRDMRYFYRLFEEYTGRRRTHFRPAGGARS